MTTETKMKAKRSAKKNQRAKARNIARKEAMANGVCRRDARRLNF